MTMQKPYAVTDRGPSDHRSGCVDAGCHGGCVAVETERNTFYHGKFLTPRDLRQEQAYFLSRSRLHNRMFHGSGVVCGLDVVRHPDEDCDGWVVIKSGLAIDCCGRELLIDCDLPFDTGLRRPKKPKEPEEPEDGDGSPYGKPEGNGERSGRPQGGGGGASYGEPEGGGDGGGDGGQGRYARPEGGGSRYTQGGPPTAGPRRPKTYDDTSPDDPYAVDEPVPYAPPDDTPEYEEPWVSTWICLRYAEERIEWVPALYADDGTCLPGREEPNRVRERVEIEICDELPIGCWPGATGHPMRRCDDDCEDVGDGGCLTPSCRCGGRVPIARIAYQPSQPQEFRVDTVGRPTLATASDRLTHIVAMNWKHGATIQLSELRELDGRLEIRFDRRIEEARGNSSGVNQFTFVVQYGGIQRDVEFLPSDRTQLPHIEDGCVAVFTIDPSYLGDIDNIAGNDVFVALKCDFIVDCLGQPVDGEHLRGELPSGDGSPGGTFESWFRVVADPAPKRRGGSAS